jgi:hypothetical protein
LPTRISLLSNLQIKMGTKLVSIPNRTSMFSRKSTRSLNMWSLNFKTQKNMKQPLKLSKPLYLHRSAINQKSTKRENHKMWISQIGQPKNKNEWNLLKFQKTKAQERTKKRVIKRNKKKSVKRAFQGKESVKEKKNLWKCKKWLQKR